MTTAALEVQDLIRFLTKEAKIPLAAALPAVGKLRKANLNTIVNISESSAESITAIFTDEKTSKQVLSAAKRISNPKKRPNPDKSNGSSPSKRIKSLNDNPHDNGWDFESNLALPTSSLSIEELTKIQVSTNRAPLVLAFAVSLLRYTRPEQPLSSRLSLAQAVVSLNSQSKAKSIGLTTEKTAEDEGWAQGQPVLTVLGRSIPVMRRAVPVASSVVSGSDDKGTDQALGELQREISHNAFWGLDLEALRHSNDILPVARRGLPGSSLASSLPIHKPEAARSYLLRSFSVIGSDDKNSTETNQQSTEPTRPPKSRLAPSAKSKEEALGTLLQALDILFSSWTTTNSSSSSTMTLSELDKKAWSWYVHVRPDVAQGQAGWGQKGVVKLSDVLKFRKT